MLRYGDKVFESGFADYGLAQTTAPHRTAARSAGFHARPWQKETHDPQPGHVNWERCAAVALNAAAWALIIAGLSRCLHN